MAFQNPDSDSLDNLLWTLVAFYGISETKHLLGSLKFVSPEILRFTKMTFSKRALV